MTKLEFMKLKTLGAKTINIEILNEAIHFLHDINVINIFFL